MYENTEAMLKRKKISESIEFTRVFKKFNPFIVPEVVDYFLSR